MGQNYSHLLKESLDGARLGMLHLLAHQASLLHFRIYLVGGVVRDILLGRTVKDIDLVVEGNSVELAEYIVTKFGGRTLTHPRFGTATWVINESALHRLNLAVLDFPVSSLSFDLISARSESYSRPGALPTVVHSSIDDDLRRRDFTINAMALRLDGDSFGELIDPLGGQKDLENKSIRVLHERSFMDDPTRIFRAARYAERYGFEIETGTLKLINNEALDVLSQLSGERLRHEFDLIFEEKHSIPMMILLERWNVLSEIHRDLQIVTYRSAQTYRQTEQLPDFVVPDILSFHQTLTWIIWLIALPVESIEAIARRLAFPTALTSSAIAASKIHQRPYPPDSKISEKTLYLDAFPTLAVYAVSITSDDETVRQTLYDYLLEWRNIKPYATGYTLQQRGLTPGPQFKELLTRLRAAWLDGELTTEEQEADLLKTLLKDDSR